MKQRKLTLLTLIIALVLTFSVIGKAVPVKADETLVLPDTIDFTILKPTKSQPLGELSVLPKESVEGAENDVLWYNNSNITTADHAYRFSYLNLSMPIMPGEEYNFSMRLKVFVGEENIGTPPTLNSFQVRFNTMSSIVYNAAVNASFVRFMNDASTYGASISKLGDMCTYFSDDPNAVANTMKGEWATFSGTFVAPEKSPYNGTQYDTTHLVLTFQLEAGAGADNTRNIYFDHISVTPAHQDLNLATSAEYWKDCTNPAAFEWNEKGMTLYDVSSASMLLYPKVKANSTVMFTIDANLATQEEAMAGMWGNAYIVFKNMNENPRSDAARAEPEGNFAAFQFGSDNPWFIECIDGEVEKFQASGTVDNNDIWYWYTGTTTVYITTEDTEDGFKTTVKFFGKSGKTSVYTFVNYDERFIGDYSVSIEFFLSKACTGAKNVTVSAVTISDVEEVALPDYDIEAINTAIGENNVTITADNYAQIKAVYDEIASAYKQFNYPLLRDFNITGFEAIGQNLNSYALNISEANEAVEIIAKLPSAITAENYQEAKESIENARNRYNALNVEAKNLVTNADVLTAAETMLAAYEKLVADVALVSGKIEALSASVTEETYEEIKAAAKEARDLYEALSEEAKALVENLEKLTATEQAVVTYEESIDSATDTEDTTSDSVPAGDGCFSGVTTSSAILSIMMLGVAFVIKKARNKE